MTGPGGGFNGSRGQPIQRQPIAQHFQKAQFFLLQMQVHGRDFDRERISGILQFGRQSRHGGVEHMIQPARAIEQIGAFIGDVGKSAFVEPFKDRQATDQGLYARKLPVGHGAVRGSGNDHQVNERVVDPQGHLLAPIVQLHHDC